MMQIALLSLSLLAASAPHSPFFGGDITTALDARPDDIRQGWFAYQTPARSGLGSLCCWRQWQNNQPIGKGCTLQKSPGRSQLHLSADFSTSHDPRDANMLTVVARNEPGRTQEVLAVTADCPVGLAGQQLTWLGDLDNTSSAVWLEALATANGGPDISSAALHALAQHADGAIEARLTRLAGNPRTAGDAIFWLGEARGTNGLAALRGLLESLPAGEVRRKINFALGENQSEGARQLLIATARQDADQQQRADALFWLANSYSASATPILLEIISTDPSKPVAEAALHGLAEVDNDDAASALREIASQHGHNEIRGKAMFWLAQGYPELAAPFLIDFLQQDPPDRLVDPAVFALSQVGEPASTTALLDLLRDASNARSVRRQALFWLAQSDDPQATNALVAMLRD